MEIYLQGGRRIARRHDFFEHELMDYYVMIEWK
jgi:hypothetical protein